MPEGTVAWGLGKLDEDDEAFKQILDEQRRKGFNVPDGLMVVGLPLGKVRHENADWMKFQLVDGRKVGIASNDSNKVEEIARKFLLAEKRTGRDFTDNDEPINIDGARVTFLGSWVPQWAVKPLWYKQREWTWTLLALCAGLASYVAMRAVGWIIDGFGRSRVEGRG